MDKQLDIRKIQIDSKTDIILSKCMLHAPKPYSFDGILNGQIMHHGSIQNFAHTRSYYSHMLGSSSTVKQSFLTLAIKFINFIWTAENQH